MSDEQESADPLRLTCDDFKPEKHDYIDNLPSSASIITELASQWPPSGRNSEDVKFSK